MPSSIVRARRNAGSDNGEENTAVLETGFEAEKTRAQWASQVTPKNFEAKLDRLRLRGLSGAKDEVLLTATAQNLRRLVKFCRPPPSLEVPCPA